MGDGIQILGQFNTLAELEAAHATGNLGDVYSVDGVLYLWNPDTQKWEEIKNLHGPEGPAGPASPSYTVIPFASQMGPRSYSSGGNPTKVTLLGFSYFDTTNNFMAIPDMAFDLEANGSFNLGAHLNRQLVFSMPFNMKIRSVHATVGNAKQFTPGVEVFPYIQIYKAEPTDNVFYPITEAIAMPTIPLGPTLVQEATMRHAFVDKLDVEVPAGTRIAIGGLLKTVGNTDSRDYYLYFTGGMGLST